MAQWMLKTMKVMVCRDQLPCILEKVHGKVKYWTRKTSMKMKTWSDEYNDDEDYAVAQVLHLRIMS